MSDLKDRLEKIKKRIAAAKERLNLAEKKDKIKELEYLVNQSDFWSIPEKAGKISRQLADLKEELEFWENAKNETEELIILEKESESDSAFCAELEKKAEETEKKIEKEELKILLSGPYDERGAVMTISSGQGGHDAEDFARMLFNMYAGYFEDQGWKYAVLDRDYSEEAGGSQSAKGERGLRSISLELKLKYSYGYFKNEAGVHRLVRVSPFDAKKLRHTSFALVEVMPDIEEIDLGNISLEDKDLKFDFARSSGPGGQNVNKRETAVRVVHLPTGLFAACQTERSQAQNRERALKILKMKIFNYLQSKTKEEIGSLKEKIRPSWGNQVRNYVFNPYQLVKDTRTEVETNKINEVFEGKIDDFIQAGLRLKR